MKNYMLVCAGVGLLLTGGCAWYDMTPIQKVDAANWGSKCTGGYSKQGYVFYQPELYFAATVTQVTTSSNDVSSTKANVTVTPIYLPNPNKAYRVKTHNILAKSGYNFAFTDGWKLTSIGDASDNSTVASAFVGQLSSLATTAANIVKVSSNPANPKPTTPQTNIVVFLYLPQYAADGTITNFQSRGKMNVVTPD